MTLEIVDLKALDPAKWLPIVIQKHPFRPECWIPGASGETQARLFEQALRRALDSNERSLLACRRGSEFVGLADLRYMAWDSNHFGFRIYRLDNFAIWSEETQREDALALAAAVVAQARALEAVAAHAWLPMEAISGIQALEGVGFRTMDVLVTWLFEHGRQQLPSYHDRCLIRGAHPSDEDVFVALAREAYTDTPDRFHADPRLPAGKSNELYAEWIRNSFNGKLADHIVVAELEGVPAGYTTLKLEGDYGGLSNVRTGALVLSAVAPWAEGRGLYTSMINGGLRWMESQGVQVSHLGTQVNNYPVQRAWARLGFRPAKAGPSLHLWLSAPTDG